MEHTKEQMTLYKEFIELLTDKVYYNTLVEYIEEKHLSEDEKLKLLEIQWKALVDYK